MVDQARPGDLTAFIHALELSAEGGYLDADDIALVESAWQIPDAVVSSYGWVLALKGDRRLYLEYTIDDTAPGMPEELDLIELRPDQTYPALKHDGGVYWYQPDHINAHLGIRPPALH